MGNTQSCQPFLRWAGGKRWLAKDLTPYLPIESFNNYHEPFLGGGSIFFQLKPKKAYLSDLNSNLINAYIQVRDNLGGVIENLKGFRNTKEDYYKIRSTVYSSPLKSAAQFIFLNATSFNGIYRVNLNGDYNVPYGNRQGYQFDFDNLKSVSELLQKASISSGDFYESILNVKRGDLVFLDPPYTVTHNKNGFIHYNKKLFCIEEQKRLSEMIATIKDIGAFYILTNAAHQSVRDIFDHGDSVFEVKRNSLVGGIGAKRGKYREIIMTNGV